MSDKTPMTRLLSALAEASNALDDFEVTPRSKDAETWRTVNRLVDEALRFAQRWERAIQEAQE